MGYELTRGKNAIELLRDRYVYGLIAQASRRALASANAIGPLCGSTSDLITHRLIATGSFEQLQLDAIDALLSKSASISGLELRSGVFLDVGANLGIFSIRYAKHFRKVIAIEANPITHKVLCANVQLRRADNVVPLCVGASNIDEVKPINVDALGMLGWSSVIDTKLLSSRETFQVDSQLKQIDQIVQEQCQDTDVSLIKLDIEGHEEAALQGADQTLRRYHPVVLYEKNLSHAKDSCAAFLRERGYNRFLMFNRKINFLMPFSRTRVIATDIDTDAAGSAALVLTFLDRSN